MNSERLRIGIVGCGKIARVSHVPGFLAVDGVEIAGLCDADAACAARLRDEVLPGGDASIHTDLDGLLGSGVEAVSICTPNHLHAPMAIAALRRGLHVLCEKPIAGTLADADAMVAAAAEAGRVLHINQSLRYHPLYTTMARLVREGAVGQVQHVRCLRAGGASPNVGWSPGANWFVSKAAQGGVLLDIGIHMADLIRWVVGDVKSVQGDVTTRTPDIDVADNVRALMRHRGGGTSVLELSWTFPAGGSAFEIHGTEGRLAAVAGGGLELTRIEDGKPVVTRPEVPAARPADSSYAAFVAAVRGEAASPTPGELGRDALAICLAIAQSSETGRSIQPAAPLAPQEAVHA